MSEALRAVRAGKVIVIPTDTVYGLACMPNLPAAIAEIFDLKGRPDGKPLPVLAADTEALDAVVEFGDRATDLARRYWPGPLTLVLPRSATFDHDLGGDDLDTVAVRIPESDVALGLLRDTGPLAVTSANRSGEPPAVSSAEAQQVFGDKVAAYVDGGPCRGLPSTVISLVGSPRVLREGAIPAAEVLS